MPLWRCPHCATPQPEAARCWVCRRSTTSCASCRHFRRGVASGLGYCGLDRNRLALRGDELRACWTSRSEVAPASSPSAVDAGDPASGTSLAAGNRRGRTFVPIEELELRVDTPPPAVTTPAAPAMRPGIAEGPRWSLWGDAEG